MVEEIIDLLDNPEFKLWVWSPNKLLNCYWQRVLLETPQKREAIQKAKIILEALTREFEVDFPESEINRMLKNIRSLK